MTQYADISHRQETRLCRQHIASLHSNRGCRRRVLSEQLAATSPIMLARRLFLRPRLLRALLYAKESKCSMHGRGSNERLGYTPAILRHLLSLSSAWSIAQSVAIIECVTDEWLARWTPCQQADDLLAGARSRHQHERVPSRQESRLRIVEQVMQCNS